MKISIGMFALVIGLFFSSCKGIDITSSGMNCTGSSKDIIKGEGSIVTSNLTLNTFTGVNLAFANNVTISYGNTPEVKATGHSNIISRIKTNVTNNVWDISLEDGCYQDYQLDIHITMPTLDKVTLSGSGDLVVNDFSNQNNLSVNLDGSGDITLNAFEGIQALKLVLSGSGDIKGNKDISTLKNFDIVLNGSGDCNTFPIAGEACNVTLSGSGDCELTATNTLNAILNGSGDIAYKGSPNVTQSVAGSGNIENVN